MKSQEIYLSVMQTIRRRFDVIEALKKTSLDDFSKAESAAFHGRKIVEAISFACLVATENGLESIPRDARGQWNAEKIISSLKSKGIEILPSPSRIRPATVLEEESDRVKVVIEGLPERRLSHDDLIAIYQRLHSWLHEINPYTQRNTSHSIPQTPLHSGKT